MSHNYFRGTIENPYHISIGAVLVNNEGQVCCHYFKEIDHRQFKDAKDLYLLMRETIEPNETIEEVLHRGLMEEFGAEATLNRYLGSIISYFPRKNISIEKTTLYFLFDFISLEESRRSKDDVEGNSEIRWINPSDLIIKMREQGIRLMRSDLDESAILERL